MACKPVQKLCPNLRISQGVTYASGVLTVNIPAGDYQNGIPVSRCHFVQRRQFPNAR